MMATNAVSSQFLDLPTDILLEILGRLPAPSIVLRCRLVCRRMDQLSRSSYLWVEYFNQTEHALRPPLYLKQIGTPEFERIICQTKTLKKIWADDYALQAAPRFWCSASCTSDTDHGTPAGIMGEYMILERYYIHEQEHIYTWVSIHDQNGPVIFDYEVVMKLDAPVRCYMDPGTNTFYVVFIELPSLVVVGFQANVTGPHKAFEYRLLLRSDIGLRWLRVKDGYAYVEYCTSNFKIEVDIIDLRKRAVSWFSLPTLVSLILPNTQNPDDTYTKWTATEGHLIYSFKEADWTGYAIFRRSTTDLDPLERDSSRGLISEAIPLGPVMIYDIPDAHASVYIIPRSRTSFVMVQIWRKDIPPPNECEVTIRVLLLTVLDEEVSIEVIGLKTIPGLLKSSNFPVPLTPVRYALGVLGIQVEHPTKATRGRKEYFAVKVDVPCTEKNSASENECQITLTRMCLAPAVDESKEGTELYYFDHFSGKIVLSKYRHKTHRANVVIDYLSTAMW